jgi:hypothetical protein
VIDTLADHVKPWESLRIIRSTRKLSFTKSIDSEYVEEVVLRNEGNEKIFDFPLPINDYRHRVEISDEENVTLSLKSRHQITQELDTLSGEVRLRLGFQLENEYLLWIVLPNNRPIEPSDTRIVHIKYYYTAEPTIKKSSSFSFPKYLIKGRTDFYPLSIYITCPAGLQLKVNRSESCAYTEDEISQFQNRYDVHAINLCAYRSDLTNLIEHVTTPNIPRNVTHRISTFNFSNLISFVIPSDLPRTQYNLSFNIEIPTNDQIKWKVGIGASIPLLFTIVTLLLFYPVIFNILGSEKAPILVGLGTALVTVIASIITLSKNSLLNKTRVLLGIPLGLSILIIFLSK